MPTSSPFWDEETLKTFVLALLHDPPWKAFTLAGRFARIRASPGPLRIRASSVHETQGLSLVADVFEALMADNLIGSIEVDEDAWNRVKKADCLAAAIERRLLNEAELEELFTSTYNVLLNPFQPKINALITPFKSYSISMRDSYKAYSSVMDAAVTALQEASSRTDVEERMRAFVHSFTTLLEVLFFKHIGTPGPADTRQPDHTVFDHVYASATIALALMKEKLTFVSVKLRGFKEFVIASRKLSDAWFASWLASALAWYATKDLVWKYGPTSLFVPSFRWNQFYLALLNEKGLLATLDELKDLYFWEGFPYYPTMPAFAVLAIPDEVDKDEIRNMLEKGWEKAVLTVIENIEESNVVPLWVTRHLEEVVDRAPFEPSVTLTSVNMNEGDCNKLKDELMKAIVEILTKKESKKPRFAWREVDWKGLLAPLSVYEKWAEKNEHVCVRGEELREPWRLCSSCARLPGTFVVPGKETEEGVDEKYKEFAERLGTSWEVLLPVFKPGERLCPYCLFKRLASLPSFFDEVAEALVGFKPNRKVSFPSTDDVAALATRLALIEAAVTIEDTGLFEEILDAIRPYLGGSKVREDALDVLETEPRKAAEELKERRWWTPYLLYLKIEDAFQRCERLSEDGRNGCFKRLAIALLTADVSFYNIYDKIKDYLKEIGEKMEREKEALREALRSPKRYVAVLRFDLDNGTLIKLGALSKDGKRVYATDKLMSKGEYILKTLESVERCALDCGEHEAFSQLKDVMLASYSEDFPAREPTPGYLSALSAAMSYSVMRTVRLITSLGGTVIYAAGDEGLAILPSWLPRDFVEEVLKSYEAGLKYKLSSNQGINAAALLRRLWWASSSSRPGFHPVKDLEESRTLGHVPAVLNGLSMGLRFAHYKDHLYSEVAAAEELLELAKKGEGDALAASFGRGAPSDPAKLAKARTSKLKFSEGNEEVPKITSVAEEVLKANELLYLIERGSVSTSILRSIYYNLGEELWKHLKGAESDESVRRGLILKMALTYAKKSVEARVIELLEGKDLEELEDFLRLVEMGRLAER